MTSALTTVRRATIDPRRLARYRVGAVIVGAITVGALVLWVPLVNELRAPCGGGLAAESCRQPQALLRWGQFAAGIVTAVLAIVTVVALALFGLRGRWHRNASRATLAFVAAAAVWLVLYLVSLPSLV